MSAAIVVLFLQLSRLLTAAVSSKQIAVTCQSDCANRSVSVCGCGVFKRTSSTKAASLPTKWCLLLHGRQSVSRREVVIACSRMLLRNLLGVKRIWCGFTLLVCRCHVMKRVQSDEAVRTARRIYLLLFVSCLHGGLSNVRPLSVEK